MITNVQPLSAGNAARLFITPPSGAKYWRVLRRTADAFTGASDTGAVVVADQNTDNAVLDAHGLVNGTPYFWRDYAWTGSAWIDSGASISATPAATYVGDTNDPHHLVRDRVELGLAVEVSRGNIKPKSGKIPVLISPFAMAASGARPVRGNCGAPR